ADRLRRRVVDEKTGLQLVAHLLQRRRRGPGAGAAVALDQDDVQLLAALLEPDRSCEQAARPAQLAGRFAGIVVVPGRLGTQPCAAWGSCGHSASLFDVRRASYQRHRRGADRLEVSPAAAAASRAETHVPLSPRATGGPTPACGRVAPALCRERLRIKRGRGARAP